jgi:uncharacterized membrane protein
MDDVGSVVVSIPGEMTRGRRRSLAPVGLLLSVALGVAATVAFGAPSSGRVRGSSSRAETAWINRTLAHMTLPEKVGQLFEVNGYGQSVRDPDPAMVKLNRQY